MGLPANKVNLILSYNNIMYNYYVQEATNGLSARKYFNNNKIPLHNLS